LGRDALSAEPGAGAAKHSLWKMQGRQNSVYLLGSIHILKKEDYPLPAVIESAFTNSQIAVFETEIEKMEDPAVAMKLAFKGRLPAGETLQDRLSPTVYSSFKKYVEKTGLPMLIFDSLTPGMAAITLVTLELKRLDLDPQYGLDKHFFDLATQAGKKIVPLETLDFQFGLLTDFSKEEGELLMKSTLKEIDKIENDLGEMLKAWQSGDSVKLEKLLNEAKEDAPTIYNRLVTSRNKTWLPKIEELAAGKENAIIIVGAGHLVGTNGVVELLRQKGYKIVQQ
jgi:uncharacterized protein YbaP (TraB family)